MEHKVGWTAAEGTGTGAPSRRQRILIASDHSIIRHGLRLMLSAATSHLVVEDDRPLRDLAGMIAYHQPDVVIADVSTGTGGAEILARVFAAPEGRPHLILLCPPCMAPGTAALAGVRCAAVVTASDDAIELLTALRRVTARTDELQAPGLPAPAFPPALATGTAAATEAVHVTPREREVIELITQGMCSKRIARTLNISVTTVRTHRQRLMSKLGLRNSVEVAQFAARAFGGGALARQPASAHTE